MEILVDGQTRDWAYDDSRTLEEVVMDINQKLLTVDHLSVVEVKLDEYKDSLDTDLTWDQVTIDQIKRISLETEPFQKNLADQFQSAVLMMDSVKESFETIVNDTLAGDIESAMGLLKTCLDKLIWTFTLIKQTERSGIIQVENLEMDGEGDFNDFVVRFNTTLKELLEAMENRDSTLINDFLEYEMEPALSELLKVLPELKKQVEDFKF